MADELARRGALPLVVSLLLSLVFTLVLSRTGGVLSHLNSLTHRFPRFPPRNLCSLVTLTVFSLVYAATETTSFQVGRIENPSCSACGHSSQDISHLILHCLATDSLRRSLFGDSLSLYDLWSRPWGVARILGLHGLPPCPIPRKGSGNQQQQQQQQQQEACEATAFAFILDTRSSHKVKKTAVSK